ncbi:MAG: exodeoxyribonuclease VII small subunit [Alistipes sp.]|nr:exodeoxyribonuclease VII small subunit [Alistipes sp.]
MENKELTYSEAIAEIEKIIARLRSEQTEVDTLSSELKRATELITRCKEQLRKVESSVKEQLEEE